MNHLNIIEVENLCFDYISYDEDGKEVGRNPVLKDVSLSVPEGQFLAVLGHNGCGKSTLAKHFNAILTPTSGKVTVAGIDTSDEDKLFDIRQTVGMVFQNPETSSLLPLSRRTLRSRRRTWEFRSRKSASASTTH